MDRVVITYDRYLLAIALIILYSQLRGTLLKSQRDCGGSRSRYFSSRPAKMKNMGSTSVRILCQETKLELASWRDLTSTNQKVK